MTTCVTPNNQFTNTPPNGYNGYPVGAFNPTGINQPYVGQPMQGNYVQGINNPQTQPFFGQPMNTGTPAFNSPIPQFFPGYFNTPQFSYGAYPIQNPMPAFNPFINGTTPWNINPFWNTTPWNTLPWQHVNSAPFQSWQNGFVPSPWNNSLFFGQMAFGQPSFGHDHAIPNFFNHNSFNPHFSSPGYLNPQFNFCGTPGLFKHALEPEHPARVQQPLEHAGVQLELRRAWNTTNINPFVNTFPPRTSAPSTTQRLDRGELHRHSVDGHPEHAGHALPAELVDDAVLRHAVDEHAGHDADVLQPGAADLEQHAARGSPASTRRGTRPTSARLAWNRVLQPGHDALCAPPSAARSPVPLWHARERLCADQNIRRCPVNPNFIPGNRPVTENGDYAGRGTI